MATLQFKYFSRAGTTEFKIDDEQYINNFKIKTTKNGFLIKYQKKTQSKEKVTGTAYKFGEYAVVLVKTLEKQWDEQTRKNIEITDETTCTQKKAFWNTVSSECEASMGDIYFKIVEKKTAFSYKI